MSHLDKVIVLDLDETLVNTIPDADFNRSTKALEYLKDNPSLRGRLYQLTVGSDKYWSVKRPNTDIFLRYLMDNFGKVIVWSAGRDDYVHEVVDWLFGTLLTSPDMTYGRSYCETNGQGNLTKPLYKLTVEPSFKNIVRMDNMVIVDDNTVSTSPNPQNAITIPRYQPGPHIENMHMDDRALLDIIDWFESNDFNGLDMRYVSKLGIFRNDVQNMTPNIKI